MANGRALARLHNCRMHFRTCPEFGQAIASGWPVISSPKGREFLICLWGRTLLSAAFDVDLSSESKSTFRCYAYGKVGPARRAAV
jgi:hypothetical protein